MNIQSFLSDRVLVTTSALILTGAFNLWDYYQGSVPIHYLLADEDLPGFSNWWGMLTIPVFTWIMTSLIRSGTNDDNGKDGSKIIINFMGGFFFGLVLTILWEFKLDEILQYVIFVPFILSLFRPVHYPECFLGFVLGMLFTFGGVLPIVIGSVLLLLSLLVNKAIRRVILLIIGTRMKK